MSSALVRQALELVDQEESRGPRRAQRRPAAGHSAHSQHQHPYKKQAKKGKKLVVVDPAPPADQTVEDNVRRLLALSTPTAHTTVADKIVERAIKGKPVLEKIKIKKEEQKSILFPDEEPYSKFEKEYFCS